MVQNPARLPEEPPAHEALQREAFDYLDAPLERVTGLDVPMPYALNLEDRVLPTEERVIDAVKRVSYAK